MSPVQNSSNVLRAKRSSLLDQSIPTPRQEGFDRRVVVVRRRWPGVTHTALINVVWQLFGR